MRIPSLITAVIVITGGTVHAQSIDVNVPSGAPSGSNVVQDNFAGVSMEFNVIDTLIGKTSNTIPTPIVNYLSALRSRMTSPFRLRIGGNSLDGSLYNPNATQMIQFNLQPLSKTEGVANVPVTYGPQLVETVGRLSSTIGGAVVLLGLSLITPNNDSDVVAFTQAAEHSLESTLDGFLLGNEPDLYWKNTKRTSNYSLPDYIQEFGKVRDDLHHSPYGNLEKKGNLGGPSICCNRSLNDTINAGYLTKFGSDLKYISLQHYAQQSCDAAGDAHWNFTYFEDHSNVVKLAQWELPGVQQAKAQGKTVIMDEYNSVSCGGYPGRSNTFAAALWSVDYSLSLAVMNFSAAYVHTREPGISYNIFTTPNDSSSSPNDWTTGPQYYSLLLLTEALKSKDGSAVIDLSITSTPNAAAYAIYDAKHLSGSPPRAVVLINYSNDTTVSFDLSGAGLSKVKSNSGGGVKYLLGRSLHEEMNVTWAGQSVDGQGRLTGQQSALGSFNGGGCDSTKCSVGLPGPGAAIVWFSKDAVEASTRSSARAGRLEGVVGCGYVVVMMSVLSLLVL